jgi:hypothetical protein
VPYAGEGGKRPGGLWRRQLVLFRSGRRILPELSRYGCCSSSRLHIWRLVPLAGSPRERSWFSVLLPLTVSIATRSIHCSTSGCSTEVVLLVRSEALRCSIASPVRVCAAVDSLVSVHRGLVLGLPAARCSLLGPVPWTSPSAPAAALVSPSTSRRAGPDVGGGLVFWDRTSCSLSWSSHVDNLRAVSYPLPLIIY